MWHGHLAHELRVTGILPVRHGLEARDTPIMGKMPMPQFLPTPHLEKNRQSDIVALPHPPIGGSTKRASD
jgi:hypothetical protein